MQKAATYTCCCNRTSWCKQLMHLFSGINSGAHTLLPQHGTLTWAHYGGGPVQGFLTKSFRYRWGWRAAGARQRGLLLNKSSLPGTASEAQLGKAALVDRLDDVASYYACCCCLQHDTSNCSVCMERYSLLCWWLGFAIALHFLLSLLGIWGVLLNLVKLQRDMLGLQSCVLVL